MFTGCSSLRLEQPRVMDGYSLYYLMLPRLTGVMGKRWWVKWLWPFQRTMDSASELSQFERIQLQLKVFMVLAYSPIHFLSLVLALKASSSSSFSLPSSGMSFWMLTSLQSTFASLQLKVTSWCAGGFAFQICQLVISWLQKTILLLGNSYSSLFLSPYMLANLAVIKESQMRRWSDENYCGIVCMGFFYYLSWDLKALLSVSLDRVSVYRFDEGLHWKGLVDERM